MSKVAIVTDSTANIPAEMLNGLPVHHVPLQLIFGEEVYLDGIDIHPVQFYTRLSQNKVNPSTSQATPVAFHDLFLNLLEQGYDILALVISSKLSGTMDSAIQARNSLPGPHIELVDSLSTSMGLGYQVLTVARAAAQGATLQECKALAEKARNHTGALFAVSTLEFLHRGGRIGGAAAFLGTALDLKPVLELRDGKIEAVQRVRTMNKAVEFLMNLFEERVAKLRPLRLGCLHANSPDEANLLLEGLRKRFGVDEISEAVLTDVSPAIGAHTGPGTVGIAYMAGM